MLFTTHSRKEIERSAKDRKPHEEPHLDLSDFVHDAVIGLADGLTVPFAIAAGLANTSVSNQTVVVAAVIAEIAAGSISMGLGGFLAARSEAEHYAAERKREEREVDDVPHVEEQEVVDALLEYGLSQDESKAVATSLRTRKKDWVDFMMRFELGLEEPHPKQALKSAATIGGAYVIGGFVPLAPYMFIASTTEAFRVSVIVTLLALALFGYLRGKALGSPALKSMWQTVLVGGIAAGAAFLLAEFVP